jgi:hypothetical protein
MMSKDDIPPDSMIETELAEAASPRAQLTGLVDDVRSLARAEWDYIVARLSYSGGVAKRAGVYALLALMLLGGASVALILGTMLIIAHHLGPLAATIITVLVFTVLALLFALRARSIASELSFDGDDDARP